MSLGRSSIGISSSGVMAGHNRGVEKGGGSISAHCIVKMTLRIMDEIVRSYMVIISRSSRPSALLAPSHISREVQSVRFRRQGDETL